MFLVEGSSGAAADGSLKLTLELKADNFPDYISFGGAEHKALLINNWTFVNQYKSTIAGLPD